MKKNNNKTDGKKIFFIIGSTIISILFFKFVGPILISLDMPSWGVWLATIFLFFISMGKLTKDDDKSEAYKKIANMKLK